MAKSAQRAPEEGFAPHSELKFDLKNPRFDRKFSKEADVLKFLIRNADVDELVTSMQSAGWVDFEPLVVERKTKTVLEGNRRLAALRLLSDENSRDSAKYKIPNDGRVPDLPDDIRVRWVNTRQEARAFIAFKHINGPFKWDALAKAKYAADWLDDNNDIADVAQQIGDTHNTVLRLVNGWRVLDQAQNAGFDVDDLTNRTGRFNFSHLYTALARPNTREFLGLPDDTRVLLDKKPVPKGNSGSLDELMGWLYGQAKQGRQHVIRSQNPDLGKLVKVIASKQALDVLRSTKDFDRSVEVVEPAENRFEEALAGALIQSEKALSLVAHFNPEKQSSLMDTMKNLASTVSTMRTAMRQKEQGDEDL